MTLLTLSTPYVLTCLVCGRKILDNRAFMEDSEWVDVMFPDKGALGLPVVGNCLYCSGGLSSLSPA